MKTIQRNTGTMLAALRVAPWLLGVLLGWSAPLAANPNGAAVVNGSVAFDGAVPGQLTVTNSPNAIINWQGFSIDPGEVTRFVQQHAGSAVLNRVVSQNPSHILGSLLSNGRVFVINPNGIVFGEGAVVDTAGLVASTLGISNEDFLAGSYAFEGPDAAGIENHGLIRTGPGGSIVLIAPHIENHGIVEANDGNLILAAGEKLTLTSLDDPELAFEVQAPDNAVVNLGDLLAPGGAASIFAGTIQHSGAISADTIGVNAAGQVVLSASHKVTLAAGSTVSASSGDDRVDGGSVQVTVAAAGEEPVDGAGVLLQQGQIRANGRHGGTVSLVADKVLSTAALSADGRRHGGSLHITARKRLLATMDSSISASGGAGDGGSIAVTGGEYLFSSGTLRASGERGGSVQLLGNEVVLAGATIDAAGRRRGGEIRVGGDLAGADRLPAAARTEVNFGATLDASATGDGDGGTIAVWSNEETRFSGVARARGGDGGGDGGFVEISGKQSWTYAGEVDVAAPRGSAGTVLWDPAFLTITAGGVGGVIELLDPNPGAGNAFGSLASELSNGKILVRDPNDDFIAADAGAVYLFDPLTGALAGQLSGTAAGDALGSQQEFILPNGNLLFRVPDADGVAGVDTGLVIVTDPLLAEQGRSEGKSAGERFGTDFPDTFTLGPDPLFIDANATVSGNSQAGALVVISQTNGSELLRLEGGGAGDQLGGGFLSLGAGANLVVGSDTADRGGLVNSGQLFLVRPDFSFTEILDPSPGAQDFFGGILNTIGGNLLVINHLDDAGGVDAGALYLFDSATGALVNRIDGGAPGDLLGSFSFTTLPNGNLLFRVPDADGVAGVDTGLVIVTDPLLAEQGRSEGKSAGERFGNAFPDTFTLGPDPLFIDVNATVSGNSLAGAVVVISQTDGSELLRLEGGSPIDRFGQTSLDLGANLVVGSSIADRGGLVDSGQLFLVRPDFSFTEILDPSPGALEGFGNRRDNIGGNLLIRNPLDDAGGVDAGALYLFDGNSGALVNRIDGGAPGDLLGSFSFTTLPNGNLLFRVPDADGVAGVDTGLVIVSDPLLAEQGRSEGKSAGERFGTAFPDTFTLGPDPLLIDESATVSGNSNAGAVVVISQVDGSELLRLEGGSANDFFGNRFLSLGAGANLVVGSATADRGGLVDSGQLFLVRPDFSTTEIVDPNPGAVDNFGGSLDNIGGNLLVRNSLDDAGGIDAGALYLFDGNSGALVNRIDGGAANDVLGNSLNFLPNGNLLFRVPDADGAAGVDTGLVIVTDPLLAEQGRSEGKSAGERFGTAFPDTFTLGLDPLFIDPFATVSGNSQAGAVVVISQVDGSELLRLEGGSSGDRFGLTSLDLGANLVVGSSIADRGGLVDSGQLFLVRPDFSTTEIVDPNLGAGDKFGDVLSQVGGNLLVRNRFDDAGGVDAGALYLFDSATGALVNRIDGGAAGDLLGSNSPNFLSNGNLLFRVPDADVGGLVDVGSVIITDQGLAEVGRSNGIAAGERLGGVFPDTFNTGPDPIFFDSGADVGGLTNAGSIVKISQTTGQELLRVTGIKNNEFLGGSRVNLAGNNVLIRDGAADVGGLVGAGRAFIVAEAGGGGGGIANNAFGDALGSSQNVAAGSVLAVLNSGANLVLQANTDLLLALGADLLVSAGGAGGDLTLQAGRSVILNGDLVTDNGNLTIVANETPANGVVAGDRAAGPGGVTQAPGKRIDAGSGDVRITVANGAEGGVLKVGQVAGQNIHLTNSGSDGRIQVLGEAGSAALVNAVNDVIINGGDLLVAGGTGSTESAKIAAGNVVQIDAANVTVQGGSGPFASAAIDPAQLLLTLTGSLLVGGGTGQQAFAQLFANDLVSVDAQGNITINGGAGDDAFAAIEAFFGDVQLVAGNVFLPGEISLLPGAGVNADAVIAAGEGAGRAALTFGACQGCDQLLASPFADPATQAGIFAGTIERNAVSAAGNEILEVGTEAILSLLGEGLDTPVAPGDEGDGDTDEEEKVLSCGI